MRHPFALAAIGFATLIAACASTHNETKTNLKAERVPVEAKDPLIFDGLAFALAGDVVQAGRGARGLDPKIPTLALRPDRLGAVVPAPQPHR